MKRQCAALMVLLAVIGGWVSSSVALEVPKFDQRVQANVVRAKKTRVEGGDFDDKRDRIVFNVTLTNGDNKAAYNDLKGEFSIWAEQILDRKSLTLLGREEFPFSLAPRGVHTFSSTEVETRWDNTGARFGAKYDSWVLIVRDSAGAIVMVKSSSPSWIPVADKIKTLTVGKAYDRALKSAGTEP